MTPNRPDPQWDWTDETGWSDEMASQGYVGQTSTGQVTLEDADPRTEGATYDTVAFATEDPAVAAVAVHPDDPLSCNVLLLAVGTTRVLCTVDPGGEPLNFAADVEVLERQPARPSAARSRWASSSRCLGLSPANKSRVVGPGQQGASP